MLAFVLSTAAPALSAQGSNRASEATNIGAPDRQSVTPNTTALAKAVQTANDPNVIATPLKSGSGPNAVDEKAEALKATTMATKDAAKDALKEVSKADEIREPHIALILPSGSKSLAKVADAVKQGFMVGAAGDGKNAPPYRLYAADDDVAGLAAQCRKAMSDGAAAIVGGVTRDGASLLAKSAGYLPTLALNAPSNVSDPDMPERFFHISLNLDWEARLAARTAAGDGLRHAAVIAGKSPLAKRIQDVFEREFVSLGGEIAGRIEIFGDREDAARVAKGIADAAADSVFITADMKLARLARPYLPQGTPVFATSLTIDPRAEAVDNLDLDNVRFMEMPWFVQPDHPAVMVYSKPVEALPIEYERLYALGIDAWRLTQLIVKNTRPKNFPTLDGVTGRITLDGHQFVRMLSAVELRDGRPALFKPVE